MLRFFSYVSRNISTIILSFDWYLFISLRNKNIYVCKKLILESLNIFYKYTVRYRTVLYLLSYNNTSRSRPLLYNFIVTIPPQLLFCHHHYQQATVRYYTLFIINYCLPNNSLLYHYFTSINSNSNSANNNNNNNNINTMYNKIINNTNNTIKTMFEEDYFILRFKRV